MSKRAFSWIKYDRYFILLGFLIISAFLSDKFLTVRNVTNLLNQNAAVGIVAIGQLLVILTGGIDLSVGSITSMSGLFIASFLRDGMNWPLAMIITLGIGFLAGTFNGFLVTRAKLPSFVVTLATMSIYQGVGLLLSKGREVFYENESFLKIGNTAVSIIPVVAIVWIVVAVFFSILLKKTVIGRYIHGIGGNREAVRLSGVNVKRYESLTYSISGILSALGGVLMASRLTLGSNSVGSGWELTAIAAVMVGGGSSTGGIGTVGGVIVGTIIMGLIGNIMNLCNVSIYWQQIIRGAIIIIAVYSSSLRERKETSV
jgi:ribose transport system permease protein